MKQVLRGLVLALIIAGSGAVTPAKAQIPVTDVLHIIETVAGFAETIGEWVQYYNTFNGYYGVMKAVTSGNYSMMPWTELFALADAPWFDGLDGIDDIRNLCMVTEMSVTQLEALFREQAIFEKMKNDPMYARSAAFRAYHTLSQDAHTRHQRRRVALAKMQQKQKNELNKLNDQAKSLRNEIARESAGSQPREAVIAALTGKLTAIEVKIKSTDLSLAASIRLMSESETQENEKLRAQMMEEIWKQRDAAAVDRKGFWAASQGAH